MSIRIGATQSVVSKALRRADQNRDDEQKSLTKLSNGQRVNRAADDAAGRAVAAQMRADLAGLEAGLKNVTSGLALVETAEAGLSATTEQLERMKELAVTAADNAMSPELREAVQAEFHSIYGEIDRIAEAFEFNKNKLLDGSVGEVDVSASLSAEALGLADVRLEGTDGRNAEAALDAVDSALAEVDARRAELGSAVNRLTGTHRNLAVAAENAYAARSPIIDAGTARETAEVVRRQVLAQASDAVTVQGRLLPSSVLNLLQ